MVEKKKMSNAKMFALVISIGIHAVIFYYLGKMALDYALPTGEVTSYEMEFTGAPTEVAVVEDVPVAPEPVAPPPTPVTPPAPKEVVKKETSPAPKPVAALPTKEVTEAAPVEDHQGEMPTAVEEAPTPVPAVDPISEKTPEPETEPTPAPVAEAPAQEVPQAIAEAPVAAAPPPQEGTPAPQMELGTTAGVQSDTVLTPLSGNKPISYPTMARFRKLEGVTVVHYTVSGTGEVTDIKIMQSSGHEILDKQAVDTIKNWKFKSTGVEGIYERPIRYSLKGDAKEAPSKLRRLGK